MNRYAVSITLYKKQVGQVNNIMLMSIRTADSEKEAIKQAISSDTVIQNLESGYKLYWKMALIIPQL